MLQLCVMCIRCNLVYHVSTSVATQYYHTRNDVLSSFVHLYIGLVEVVVVMCALLIVLVVRYFAYYYLKWIAAFFFVLSFFSSYFCSTELGVSGTAVYLWSSEKYCNN